MSYPLPPQTSTMGTNYLMHKPLRDIEWPNNSNYILPFYRRKQAFLPLQSLLHVIFIGYNSLEAVESDYIVNTDSRELSNAWVNLLSLWGDIQFLALNKINIHNLLVYWEIIKIFLIIDCYVIWGLYVRNKKIATSL